MARTKLTEGMVGQAIRLKADGLLNGGIICALGIHESTFYRWVGNPRDRLQRALCEGLKKEEATFKQTLLTTIRAAAQLRVVGGAAGGRDRPGADAGATRRSPVPAARGCGSAPGAGGQKQMNLTRWDEPAEIGAEAVAM